ncbi:response regulator transcription factor [Burkholderia sp. JSH-S8]|nr:response regulator transcription factor [Burkholderia sp. JSH-S8]
MTTKLIKVGVADDHPIVLRGVQFFLEPNRDIDIRFMTGRIGELLNLLIEKPVDVLLCDYEFESDPHADGLNLLGHVQRIAPETRVIFLSSNSSPYIVSSALAAGAAGFIGKRSEEFVNPAHAIRAMIPEHFYLPESLRKRLLSSTVSGATHGAGIQALSDKEATVVRMISNGLTIGDIAARLKRSPKTISNQKNAGMRKLGVSNDVELCRVMRDIG